MTSKAARTRTLVSLAGGLLAWGACGPAERAPDPPTPSPRTSPEAPLRFYTPAGAGAHAEDGEGRVVLDPADPVLAGSHGRWTVTWIAGPSGLDAGDGAVLQISPFWGWSEPQTRRPGAPGYTTLRTSADARVGITEGQVPHTVIARVESGRLAAGDTLSFVYGDSTAGGAGSLARADRYAEAFEELYVKTDGNGDGFFAAVPDQPTLRILPGPARMLTVAAPTVVAPGAPFDVTVCALDFAENRAEFSGEVALRAVPLRATADAAREPSFELGTAAPSASRARRSVVLEREGLYRIEARLAADSTVLGRAPLVLVERDSRFADLLWADLHVHSALSDGTGAPADLYDYARDVSGLDVAAVTDHDAHGLEPLPGRAWDVVRGATEAAYEPGRFVTLLGYEWTSWTWGHRNVYYPGAEGEVFPFLEEASSSPAALWERIARYDGVTIPHHPGGGPVPVNWSIPGDPERETVVEICSIHGSSEALNAPRGIYRPVPGASVRDALDAGHRLGILASGDTHDGHPGRRTRGAPAGGLAALRGAERTRASVMAALADRRVYGTSGARVLVDSRWAGVRPGRDVAAADAAQAPIVVHVVAPEPIEAVELFGPSGRVSVGWGGGRRARHELDPGEFRAEEWRYVRVLLADGEIAWDSPWWIGGDS